MKKSKAVTIKLFDYAGKFAENKDIAKEIRENYTGPALKDGGSVIFDFYRVDSITQSFTHALISEHIREFGINVLDRIFFKNCNDTVKRIVEIVTEYMQRKIK